jgi:microcystin-dependent protein
MLVLGSSRKISSLVLSVIMVAGSLTFAIPGAMPEAEASDPFIAQIQYMPFNFSPRGWAFCDGQLLQISQNTALFSLVGTIYGGDGRTTFGIPDMRGRLLMHEGTGPGLTPHPLGQRGGTETVTLTLNQLPSHLHQVSAPPSITSDILVSNSPGNTALPIGNSFGSGFARAYSTQIPDVQMHSDSVSFNNIQTTATGGGGPHNNLPPYLVVNCNIALQGVFPSRN